MLKPQVKRLSDINLAVQLVAKETDFYRLREANAERVEQLAIIGCRCKIFVEEQFRWFLETFELLKGRSRVILAAYKYGKAPSVGCPASDVARGAGGACAGTSTRKHRNRRAEATAAGLPILKAVKVKVRYRHYSSLNGWYAEAESP